MKTNEERLEDLLSSKLFQNLNEEEKQFVLDVLGSEEQYKALQRIDASLLDHSLELSIAPEPEVLISLKQKLRDSNRKSFFLNPIVQFRIPAYAAFIFAAMTAFVVLISSHSDPKERLVEVRKLQIDTVYVTRTDTVYREKLLIKYVRVSVPSGSLMVTASVKSEGPKGVTMKDKEELDKLLVSGLN
jgi:hypothetical protein